MQINLSSTFPQPSDETTAKSKDSAAAGSADSFFEQIGQMLRADSSGSDARKSEKSANQNIGNECPDSAGAETGDPALTPRSINAELVYTRDMNVSDASTAPEAEIANVIFPIPGDDGDSEDRLLQLPTVEETEDSANPPHTANPIGSSASSELPIYWSCVLAEATAETLAPDCQNIGGTGMPDDIELAVSDAEGKLMGLIGSDITDSAKPVNIFREVFADQQNEGSAPETEDAGAADIDVLRETVEAAEAKSNEPASASIAGSLKQTAAPPRSEAVQKGLPVDPTPPTDAHPESVVQLEFAVAEDPSDAADKPLQALSSGESEKPEPPTQTPGKQEPIASDASDNLKDIGSRAAENLSRVESISNTAPQNKSESMLTAALGKSQSAGAERVQEVHSTGIFNSFQSVEMNNSTVAAGPASQAQSRQFIDQIAEQIQLLVRDGKGEIRIQLKPDALGRIEIKAESTLSGVVARITTETSHVKTYLENNIQVLQQTLTDQGLRIDRIQIVAQDSFDAQFSSGRNAHFGQAGSGRNGQDSNSSGNTSGLFATGVSDEMVVEPAEWLAMNPNNRFYTVA